jgi:hypothetical protein
MLRLYQDHRDDANGDVAMGQLTLGGPIDALAASEAVLVAVVGWPGVTTSAGPIEASTELRFRRQVIGHVFAACGDRAAVDAIFPPTMGEALIALGRGERHPVTGEPGWVLKCIHAEADIAAAIALLRDNYDRLASRLRVVASN